MRGSLAALCVLAAALRLAGVFTDFWLDEIWSLDLAASLHSPWEVFTKLHIDNNHYLNTLFMYLLGERADWRWYRLLSLLTGICSVPLAAAIGRRKSEAAGWAAAILIGFSYPLVVYSSEARGYGPMVFFALLAFYFLERREAGRFSLAAVMGFLSQLTFVHFYVAALVVSIHRLWKSPKELLRWHLAPCLAALWLFWIDIRHLTIGGGTQEHPFAAAFGLAVGLPETGVLGGLVTLGLLAAGWRSLRRESLFYLIALFLSPALFLLVLHPQTLFPRYFLVSIVFFLIFLAQWLGGLYPRRRGLYFTVLLLLCAGNGFKIARFLEYGRGRYAEAVDYMISQAGGAPVTVGSDHDFRNPMVLQFYLRRAKTDAVIRYSSQGANELPDWRLAHTFDVGAEPAPRDGPYVFVKAFRHGGLSGWTWFLYRKA